MHLCPSAPSGALRAKLERYRSLLTTRRNGGLFQSYITASLFWAGRRAFKLLGGFEVLGSIRCQGGALTDRRSPLIQNSTFSPNWILRGALQVTLQANLALKTLQGEVPKPGLAR